MNERNSHQAIAGRRPAMMLMMLLCGFAGAATPEDVPSTVVRYAPASLATDGGTKALYRRLVKAAEDVCPTPHSSRIIPEAVLECRDQAVARAVQQIGNPALAALHAGIAKRG